MLLTLKGMSLRAAEVGQGTGADWRLPLPLETGSTWHVWPVAHRRRQPRLRVEALGRLCQLERGDEVLDARPAAGLAAEVAMRWTS